MALVSENLVDIGGGMLTVAASYDDRTRRLVLLAVTNGVTIQEQSASVRFVAGEVDVLAPPGYTERTWEADKGPVLPKDRPAPRLEVRYG